ncbi:60S ribosomal protein L23a [Sciurus carolinensis]|uniref:60S ribosomal protein L23a n=1 Tax=Sciurus carolinensis TaxID=30640 RepID=A0AA41N2A3_SCICA|nr:60S ribosomal protein L23a [Sciurus carolinensis]
MKKLHVTPLLVATLLLWLWRQPKYPQKNSPRRNKLDHHATTKIPLAAGCAIRRQKTKPRVFTVDVKANKQQIRQPEKLYDIEVTKVNTHRPDEEKTYIHVAPDHETLDVASRTGIIQTEPSCLTLNILFFNH